MMRRIWLATTLLTLATGAHAQSPQSGTIDGMPYVVLPASGGCSVSTPCSVVTYLSFQDETAQNTASDVQNYFGGSFAQANPHTLVIAPTITASQDSVTNWGGYDSITTPQQAQMVAVVQGVEASMGNTVNTKDSVVTGGSLGGDGTQSALIAYGPKGTVQPGVFDAGLSFDAATYAASGNAQDIAALCGVPLIAVHGTADTNQSVTYDEALQTAIDGNPACGNSFTFVPIQGAGHGTWSGPDGYSEGVGTGTPLGGLSSDIQSRATGTPSTAAPAVAAPADPPAATPAASTSMTAPATTTKAPAATSTTAATATTTTTPQNKLTVADDEIAAAEALSGETDPDTALINSLVTDAQAQIAASQTSSSTPAASGTITPGQGLLSDCSGNVWTINGNNKILENGVAVVGGGDTSQLTMQGCTVMGLSNGQNGSSTNWFTMNSTSPTTTNGWTVSAAPTGATSTTSTAAPSTQAATTTPATATPATPAATTAIAAPTVCGSGVASGAFHVANGQIIGPNGQPFIARGINMADSDMGDASAAIALFPGLNFVRLAVYTYQDPSAYSQFISTMTSQGTVVEIEHHVETNGATGGGGQGGIASGSWLASENAFYASMAHAYASNAYVWFGTTNEPPTAPGLSEWQQATYNAIRGAGNNSIILLEIAGWPGGWQTDMDAGVYASMTNVVWDTHYYGWISNYSTDQGTVNQALASEISGAQTITSADGTVPALIGEYGPSTTGESMDPNSTQVVQAVVNDGGSGTVGSGAWHWGMQDCCNNLNSGSTLTNPYGQTVALYINTSVMPCTTAEATANANATLASVTTQVAAAAQTPAPATTPTAAQPAADPTTDALNQAAETSIAQGNVIVSAAQAQMQPSDGGP
jgi:hypothetical protein